MHWYKKEGGAVVRYVQNKKDGTPSKVIRRGQALADGAVPSVTTILDFLGSAGGLVQWACNQGVDAGLSVGMSAAVLGESLATLTTMAKEQAKESMERAATEGTAIHDAIERHLLDPSVVDSNPILSTAQRGIAGWLTSRGILPPFRCEHAVMYRGKIGEVTVAYAGTLDGMVRRLLWDVKSVEDTGRGFRKPKWSEPAQLASYRLAAWDMGLCDEDAECANLYVDRRSGRLVGAILWPETALKHGLSLLALAVQGLDKVDKIEACLKRAQKGE